MEALSVSGYSGSAVVVFTTYVSGLAMDIGVGTPVRVSDPRLLGVNWGHLKARGKSYVQDEQGARVPDLYVRQNSGVAAVVPAWKITELLQIGKLKTMREEQRREFERDTGHGVPDSAEQESTEFEKFQELTRKIVNVPKKELDEKRKDES